MPALLGGGAKTPARPAPTPVPTTATTPSQTNKRQGRNLDFVSQQRQSFFNARQSVESPLLSSNNALKSPILGE